MVADPLVADEPLTPSPAVLSVTSHLAGQVLTLSVTGEADVDTADAWRTQLADARAVWPYAVVIDVSGLLFCGLAGLDVLNEALTWRQAEGPATTVTGMSRQLAWLHHTFPATAPDPPPGLAAA